ncbi:hypothetical protein [Bordetella genomosp. 6]|uniref:hypothetical protein n=1 Tax=Bordetella genomosp. 6 TaxID=463024 RepID=UPI000A292A8B|nr:hypothetical protein [Bordetella genomosp. 6]ARP78550.1 hypothetical protein CAL11_21500 [Bordetella genomosp. 6]
MQALPLNVPHYPMLRFVARHGRNLVLAIAIVLLAAGVAMLVQMPSAIPGAIAIVAAVIVFVIGRALVEMVELITDMLLPK